MPSATMPTLYVTTSTLSFFVRIVSSKPARYVQGRQAVSACTKLESAPTKMHRDCTSMPRFVQTSQAAPWRSVVPVDDANTMPFDLNILIMFLVYGAARQRAKPRSPTYEHIWVGIELGMGPHTRGRIRPSVQVRVLDVSL